MAQITPSKNWVDAEVITEAGLDSNPNTFATAINDLAGQYKTLLTVQSSTDDDMVGSATYFFSSGLNVASLVGTYSNFIVNAGPPNIIASGAPTTVIPTIYFDSADALATTLVQKLRVRAQINCNLTSWGVTGTIGLYPVTYAGAADTLTITGGTVVSGSTVAIASPTNAGNPNSATSGDFTIPSNGQYALAMALSGNLTNNAAAAVSAQLQYRSV